MLQGLEEATLKQHFLLNSERLAKWKDIPAEVSNVSTDDRERKCTANGHLSTRVQGRRLEGKCNGNKGVNSDVPCDNGGRKGHLKKDCWGKLREKTKTRRHL